MRKWSAYKLGIGRMVVVDMVQFHWEQRIEEPRRVNKRAVNSLDIVAVYTVVEVGMLA